MTTRRDFLLRSGAVASLGAIAAACGDTGGPSSPGRLGVAPPIVTLASVGTPTDIELLRTAQSMHHLGIVVLEWCVGNGEFDSAIATAAAAVMIDNHAARSEQLAAAIVERGGEPFACTNPFITERFVEAAFAATEGTDNLTRDTFNIAIVFEELIARSHHELVGVISELELRPPILEIANQVSRQSTFLAKVKGEPVFEPTMLGDDAVETDADGFPIWYIIPSTFARLEGLLLVLGEFDEEFGRVSLSLQTPADNSYVWEFMTCSP